MCTEQQKQGAWHHCPEGIHTAGQTQTSGKTAATRNEETDFTRKGD